MNSHEVWQVEVQGNIYEANVEEIIEWINEGSVLPEDKVRKGSLRWLKADRVPELYTHFKKIQFKNNASLTTSLTNAVQVEEIAGNDPKDAELIQNFLAETASESEREIESVGEKEAAPGASQTAQNKSAVSTDCCSVHEKAEAKFICGTCLTLFCKTCPDLFGGNVKICLECGAMCRIYTGVVDFKSVGAINKPYPRGELDQNNSGNSILGNFGLRDLGRAVIYPFKFKMSLIVGAGLFMLFMLGQTVSAFGISMLFAAAVCLMLANTLVFGCLANTLDNFAQGKTNLNFMPGFDEFELWDDVIHPFLLSFGIYIVSFGLFLILLFGALWQTSKSENKIEEDKQKIVSTVLPRVQNLLSSSEQAAQSAQVSELLKQNQKAQTASQSGEKDSNQSEKNKTDEADELQKLQAEIQRSLNQPKPDEIPSYIENEKGFFDHTIGTILRLSLIFSVPIFIAFLWGIFYFPAACAVAGYTRSFKETLNPLIAFDTIKRLGFDYFKIVIIFTTFIALTFGLNTVLQLLFSTVDLPVLGNLPAKAVVSVFAFYLTIVFSVALGLVLANNSDKLNLRHN